MIIVGVDYHPSVQQVAFLDTETGETGERRLNHSDGEAERTGQLRFPMSRAIACHSWRNGEAARNREVLLTPKLLETLRD